MHTNQADRERIPHDHNNYKIGKTSIAEKMVHILRSWKFFESTDTTLAADLEERKGNLLGFIPTPNSICPAMGQLARFKRAEQILRANTWRSAFLVFFLFAGIGN